MGDVSIFLQSVTEVAGMSNGYRRPRTSADFYEFCTMVLQYENYEGWTKDVSTSAINPLYIEE